MNSVQIRFVNGASDVEIGIDEQTTVLQLKREVRFSSVSSSFNFIPSLLNAIQTLNKNLFGWFTEERLLLMK
jgi:hypothetical protein